MEIDVLFHRDGASWEAAAQWLTAQGWRHDRSLRAWISPGLVGHAPLVWPFVVTDRMLRDGFSIKKEDGEWT